MRKAIVLAGSRGIGKGIADALSDLEDISVVATSSSDLDTSKIDHVDEFISEQISTDILVLNTGGPPAKKFENITKEDCEKYHNQLFYSFFRILQKLRINDEGFVFLVSSYGVKEPETKLILSNAYRLAFIGVLKCLSKDLANRGITTINIAPGPIDTDRLRGLTEISKLSEKMPLGRVGTTKEIGDFVKSIVEHNIKNLTGVTINFDGGKSNYVL